MAVNPYSAALDQAFAELGKLAQSERSEARRLAQTLELLDRTGGLRDKKVLELGSSIGVLLVALGKLGAQAQGLDKFVFPETHDSPFRLSLQDFEQASAVWKNNNVSLLPHDLAERLPFADGTFDVVVCNAVIEHIHGIHKQLFQEVRRVLKPGGRFVFTTPNLAMLLKRVRFIFGRSPNWDIQDYFKQAAQFTGHIREFTVPECRRMLAWSGFGGIKVYSRPTYFSWRQLKMPKLWHRLLLQGVSLISPDMGDLIFAIGRKPQS
ncbi:MAG: class I SAM-dependent methyltransferase [Patescibacteria group bacterium]